MTSGFPSDQGWLSIRPRRSARFQVSAYPGMQFDDLISVFPIHIQNPFLISSSAGNQFVFLHSRLADGIRSTDIRPTPMNFSDIEATHTDLPIDVTPPPTEEIRMAIQQIKSRKAAEPDNIPAEALKSNIEETTNMPHLFKKIWEEEQVPMDWEEGHLIKMPKKGDLSRCGNYRGITLLSIPWKVFNRVLLDRMKDAVDAQLRDQQAGFRKYQSFTGQIATLRIIIKQSIE
ncbi:unnamed protein product [Schistosoma curassoni]|uniref:Reverse transcriptase domain-containing protein n=1 Tax=Schistosoma curassoni TaxID=6186 RepID=A0A183JC59_9TREM|nr:unnamed protein product [Schistosoma curassoni]